MRLPGAALALAGGLPLLGRGPSAASPAAGTPAGVAELLAATAASLEREWRHVARGEPLVPIGLPEVEAWLRLTGQVAADDVELFAAPPPAQAGFGGEFQSSPRPVPVEGRLEKVREAFGEGQALVINSLHRWCPEAAQLASALRAQLGLPVDVYMYLTPPYSHSYGLHSDVMDAFMVQLVGRKHWLACSGENCTSVDTENGDVLYLPMRARHSAWTSGELSAHLTVNVERQFYVWGSVLQAVAKRLLLPGAGARLDGLADMKPFGLEEEGSHDDNELVRLICRSAPSLPALVQMPGAVLNHTRDGAELNGEGLEQEWFQLLRQLRRLRWQQPIALQWHQRSPGGGWREFPSAGAMVRELQSLGAGEHLAALSWVAGLISRSLQRMHEQHSRAPARAALAQPPAADAPPERLSALAAGRASALGGRARGEL